MHLDSLNLLATGSRASPATWTRRAFAISLIAGIFSLTLVSVIHIHGISDPLRPHTFGELFVLAVARAGLALASVLVVLVAVLLGEWVARDCFEQFPQTLFLAYPSRAPPRFLS